MNEKVMRTQNYSIFKTLPGNRGVEKIRVEKIKKSISENGYIFNPIICNEMMQVIDGQARLSALRELELPVDYLVHRGLTVQDCIALNVYQTKWSTVDYINSHADRGVTDYIYLRILLESFPSVGLTPVTTAVTGKIDLGSNAMKNGKFSCTLQEYERATEVLSYASMFVPLLDRAHKGSKTLFLQAIMFAYQLEKVDKDKLFKNFSNYFATEAVSPFVGMPGALQAVNDVYNYRSRDRIRLDADYYDYQCEKHGFYAAKYAGKYNRKKENEE